MGRPSLRRRFSQTIDLIGDKTAAATVGVQLPHAVLDRAAKVFYGGRSREWGKPQKRILLRPVAALGLWCLAIFAAPVPAVVDIALHVVLLYGLMAHGDAFEPLSPPS